MNSRTLALLAILSSILLPYAASQTEAPSLAASALTAVPPLVPYSGQVEGRTVVRVRDLPCSIKTRPAAARSSTESQIVSLDPTGHYKVQLGAANPNGLPSDLFATGEARWLEVQIAGQPAEPRTLLASVSYALKAADAATLGGLPASAFALAGSNTAVANVLPGGVSPDAVTTVTTTGGTTNKVAKFSGANTIVNSILYDNGTEVGIGTTSPTATLTVDGTIALDGATTFNGAAVLGATGTATSTHSYSSQLLKAYTSAYNSSTKAVVQPRFEWQAEVKGNNTSTPSGTLNLPSRTPLPAPPKPASTSMPTEPSTSPLDRLSPEPATAPSPASLPAPTSPAVEPPATSPLSWTPPKFPCWPPTTPSPAIRQSRGI